MTRIGKIVAAVGICTSLWATGIQVGHTVDININITGEVVAEPCIIEGDFLVPIGNVETALMRAGEKYWNNQYIEFQCDTGGRRPRVSVNGTRGNATNSLQTTKSAEGLDMLVEYTGPGGGTEPAIMNAGFVNAEKWIEQKGTPNRLWFRAGVVYDNGSVLHPGPFSAVMTVDIKYD